MVHLSAALTNVPKSVHDANPIIVQVSAFFDQSFEFLVVFERIRKKASVLILLSACAGTLKETGMHEMNIIFVCSPKQDCFRNGAQHTKVLCHD